MLFPSGIASHNTGNPQLIRCSWFSYVFTYTGNNRALTGFFNAIELIMETGFALVAFVTVILNLVLPEEIEDEDAPELTANTVDEEKDHEEWDRIRRKEGERVSGSSRDAEIAPATTDLGKV
jgi:NCS2 family nucleobase:cation symporter-2